LVRDDWLVGGDRRAAAAERIYATATDVIAHGGLDAFDIDDLARRMHCSRATIYRHAGGKAQIRDAVLVRAAARIVEEVRRAVADLTGSERIVTAIAVALKEIRSDPMGNMMITMMRGGEGVAWLTESPIVANLATELNGLTDDDSEAVHWIVRIVMSHLWWPIEQPEAELRSLQRFVAPAFGTPT
jgi:AcrR family transcriptional regulator